MLKNGECFELIDRENYKFRGQLIKDVIQKSKIERVLVVCIIGLYSSGKSTLMNYVFGT